MTAEQDRAAMLSSTILQAQMAQNLSARAQLLSHRTQELNSYSVAIEEMLRTLSEGSATTSADGGAATAAVAAAAAAPSSRPGSSPARSGATHGSPGMERHRYASAIMPGPLSSTATAADAQRRPLPGGGGGAYAHSMSGAQDSSTMMEYDPYEFPNDAEHYGGDVGAEQEDEEEEEEEEDGYEEMSQEVGVEEEGEEGEEGGSLPEEEETEEPLNDLLPSLSFNELGQSLMDLRAGRHSHASELREQMEEEGNANFGIKKRNPRFFLYTFPF